MKIALLIILGVTFLSILLGFLIITLIVDSIDRDGKWTEIFKGGNRDD